VTSRPAIRTGSWFTPKAFSSAWALVAALVAAAPDATARQRRIVPDPPLEMPGTQYAPVQWSDLRGWTDDDHLAAFRTFLVSCKAITATRPAKAPDDKALNDKALGQSLREPCRAAAAMKNTDAAQAKSFFEHQFAPIRLSKIEDLQGFVTGYYEPIVDGARERSEIYNVPVYRRPSNLFVRGQSQATLSMPNNGQVFRKIGRRKLVPYYDRGEIEDGAIAGRGLEVAWLKSQTDLLFLQIQGSARVKLAEGGTLRLNYEAHNGYPYTPVGRVLIDRGIVPREQMSMQRIRQWMEDNPGGASELRRQNRSYVFMRKVDLGENDEAVGAQSVPLTAWRSIAVDSKLHVYGTPFHIDGDLPIASEKPAPFARLMIAQDTGSAIVGPARADLYFGAGAEAAKVAGRLRHPAQFAMLVPKALDPLAHGRTMPLPQARPTPAKVEATPPTRRHHHRRHHRGRR
jgi:membrane-bound lytic murein transglycosylase A